MWGTILIVVFPLSHKKTMKTTLQQSSFDDLFMGQRVYVLINLVLIFDQRGKRLEDKQDITIVGLGQWFVLIRKHAVAVVKDTTVFPVFQQYCKV
jgi:hypothetical protein